MDPSKEAPSPNEAPSPKKEHPKRTMFVVMGVLGLVAVTGGIFAWAKLRHTGPGAGFASGNGRLEATEIDVATKLAGRVDDIVVHEGDFVKAGQPLAKMAVPVLEAQRDEARALEQQAIDAVAGARAQTTARESNKAAAQSLVVERESELDAAKRRLARSEALFSEEALPGQELDDDRARMLTAQAAVQAARAQVDAAQAAIDAAKAQVVGLQSAVAAAEASVARVQADILDSQLTSPRDGRVQYRVAEPGEVLSAGGKVLNLVDLNDVFMTFFLPETVAGRVALGADVRLVLDAAPTYVIPATVSFVASTAQFTPKTVETANERQKLMFRVKAKIAPALLQEHLKLVKTGLPGVAWLRVDSRVPWPAELAVRVP